MRQAWKPKPGDRMVRHPRGEEMEPVRLTVTSRKPPSRFVSTPLMIVYLFAGLIVLGTLLLLLPFTHHQGGFTPFLVALFTATSAITVTGLVVQDTAAYWTRTGHVIILGMMYLGGLGIMTFATFLLVLIGHRVTIAQRLLVREILLVNQLGGLVRLAIGIVLVATAIQVVGFLALFARFYFLYPPAEAVWQAAFHSVSGFNGAGFVVLNEPNQLMDFQGDIAILGILTLLIFIGAISYLVIIDLVRYRRFSPLTLNTKLVLVFTAALTLIGIVGFLGPEYGNPQTLGPMPVGEKIAATLFQVNSGRTAGFTVFDLGDAHEHTNLLTAVLMFIGGASASVAGGIKLNTIAVIFLAVAAILRGSNNVSAYGREIPFEQVQRAMIIGAIAIAFVFVAVLLLSITESAFRFLDLFFESMSAFGTVGLSTGVTPHLSSIGQLILVVTMFIGKLGPLTVGLSMAQRSERDLYRYSQEPVMMG